MFAQNANHPIGINNEEARRKRLKVSKAKESKLAESHRRQFEGEDYQGVANDLADDEEEYDELSTSPHDGCECGFCETAKWWD